MTVKDSHLYQFTNMTLSIYFKYMRYSLQDCAKIMSEIMVKNTKSKTYKSLRDHFFIGTISFVKHK